MRTILFEEIKERFGICKLLNEKQAQDMDAIRIKFIELAAAACDICPDSRDRSVALTHLETASMFINKAISRGE